jgi:DNA-binding MurR/RpiR family transcriptional regulator
VRTSKQAAYLREGADLFERVRSGSDTFTPSFRRVAEYIVNHTQEVAFSPAAKVAAAAGVSESVVVRFARVLGYAGYPSMQQAAQAFVRSQLIGPSARFDALPITSASTPRDIFHSVLLRDVRNLHRTDEYLPNHSAFTKTVDAVVDAQRVYVVGFRGLSSLASLTAFLLDMAGVDAVPVTHGDAFGFQTASRMRKGDALLAFAFVRYTTATRDLVEMARRLDAPTIVICDSVMAPAAHKADYVLQAAVDSSSFHNSYTAAVSCINALIVAISTKCRTRVARRLREVDEHLPAQEFDTEESGTPRS